jgi:GNAT superfamily N-acetyltransferase
VAALLGELGYPTDAAMVADRFAALRDADRVLLAEAGVGLTALHRVPLLAEGGSLVRITALVVAADHRHRGVAQALLVAAEQQAREWRSRMLEVSSGQRAERGPAHEFYRSAGFHDTGTHSTRYWKHLS